ncbi:hypothetical protein ACEN9H_26240 [Massilia cellulosiltytica]|jgi:hypothetical protein|uniref:hypothetical protein n=1 Tax=Massilia cellulosiltytica TaxID=2683234 RepID=UPI0039B4C6F4
MPRLILTLLALAVLFCLLCGPVTWVALRLWKRGDLEAFRPLRAVWIAQVALASALVFGADSLGLANPMGWMVALVFAVSLGGAALFALWRMMARAKVRMRVRGRP